MLIGRSLCPRWAGWLFVVVGCVACSPVRSQPRPEVPRVVHHPVPRETPLPRSGPVVFLDPGHGGRDGGAAVKGGRLQEKHLTLDVARRIEKILTGLGYQVVMSRRQDAYVSLAKRVELARRERAEVFISIHFNTAASSLSLGSEIFFWKGSKTPRRSQQSKQLGTHILHRLRDTLPAKARGVKHGNFYVVRETSVPAVLVEVAFMTNPYEAKLLSTSAYKQRIASAIAGGIDEYFHPDHKHGEMASPARIERAACRLGGDRSIH